MFSTRKSTRLLFFTVLEIFLLALLLTHSAVGVKRWALRAASESFVVRRFALTDLCLFPEARYTRHVTQADQYSAFQDHPLSLEHFVAGSFLQPPEGLWSDQ